MQHSGSNDELKKLGFAFGKNSVHVSRTMMFEDLQRLLIYIDDPTREQADYRRAVVDDNCLGKRSSATRRLTYRFLVGLYSLDPSVILFRSLRYFWTRDELGQPLLALLCAYCRDPILRSTSSLLIDAPEGTVVRREDLEDLVETKEPGRFSKVTVTSIAQHVNSTFTKSGHLRGKAKKVRSRATPTVGSVSYALLLGYLSGARGVSLFETPYAKLLDCGTEQLIDMAQTASQRGWLVFNHVGNVIEVLFPGFVHNA